MVKFQPSKLAMRVRFPLPAPSVEPLNSSMNRLPIVGLLVLILGLRSYASPPATGEKGDKEVLAILRADIAEKPSRVLIAVEDALTMNEQAACEIVKSAIEATKADARLVGEIVYTALKNAPGMAASISQCALNVRPEAVDQVKDAMKRAFGEKATSVADAGTQKQDDSAAASAGAAEVTGKGGKDAAPGDSGNEDFL